MANVTLGTTHSVGVTATAPTTILAANENRLGALINNATGTAIFVLLGDGTVSPTFFSKQMSASELYWQIPDLFTGVITCIRNSGTTPQPVLVTEITST